MIAALCCALVLAAAPAQAKEPGKQVDLNTASATELCTLPGIGPKKAEAILALRQKKPFTRVTQLLQVKGIGPRTLDKLKPHLRLSEPKPAPPLPPLAPLAPATG